MTPRCPYCQESLTLNDACYDFELSDKAFHKECLENYKANDIEDVQY